MSEPAKCPKCFTELTSQNRLITESCGHSKCRRCLITEEGGCAECLQQQDQPQKVKEKINIIEDRCLSIGTRLPEKLKTGKTAFPSHIVRECIDNKTVYLCTICDKRFNSRTQQYYHLFCSNSSNKPHKCEECFKTFASSSHLKYHMEGHTPKSLSCSICGKTFAKVPVLRKHEKLHSAVVQECDECGIKLKNKAAFIAHMQRHKNIFPYSCNSCEKKFTLKSTLQMHKAVHSGVKRFKCNQCEKKFDRNSTLKLHILRHSKLKRYACSECSKRFIDTKSLMRHRKIHAGACKYKCTFCDTTSIRKDNISRHIRNMHPNESKDCIQVINEDMRIPTHVQDAPPEGASATSNYPNHTERSDLPKTVANSSVIKCIGNVQPVIVPENITIQSQVPVAAATHKKLKKKYDPREIYRKILLDEESTTEADANTIGETTSPSVDQCKLPSETTAFYNGQQSNFSETHWRKNFKHTYQTQFD